MVVYYLVGLLRSRFQVALWASEPSCWVEVLMPPTKIDNPKWCMVQFTYVPLLLCKFLALWEKVPGTFCLVKMLRLMIGTNPQERLFIGWNLSEKKIRSWSELAVRARYPQNWGKTSQKLPKFSYFCWCNTEYYISELLSKFYVSWTSQIEQLIKDTFYIWTRVRVGQGRPSIWRLPQSSGA
jgi:hypothetical protein